MMIRMLSIATKKQQFMDVLGEQSEAPVISLEKDQGNMTSEGCNEHKVPLVVDWVITMSEDTDHEYFFMQDNASVYKARPAYSPNLNFIENVWTMMKYYIQEQQLDFEQRRQRKRAKIRPIVLEAWYHSKTEAKLSTIQEQAQKM